MSYPSIHAHLEKMGVTSETATDNQMQTAFIGAFKEDLSLGFAKVKELVGKLRNSDKDRVMLSLDPKSVEGQQYTRLLCPDISRQVLEHHFGVVFGFYNCCKGIAANEKKSLGMTFQEQIESQDPSFVDC